jgi:hypothetical protein
MTEQRQAQHYEVSVALLRAHIEALQQQLVDRQLEEYPDSRIMTEREVRNEWIDRVAPHILKRIDKHCDERAAKLQRIGVKVEEVKNAYAEERQQLIKLEQEYVASCVLLATMQDPVRVFYECGKNEDGTYKFRGCRVGVEGHQYMSGFSRF